MTRNNNNCKNAPQTEMRANAQRARVLNMKTVTIRQWRGAVAATAVAAYSKFTPCAQVV